MNSKALNLLHQAIQHFHQGNWDKAETQLVKALRILPTNADALHLMGFIKGAKGNHQEAVRYLEKAAQFSPDNPEIQLNLGKALDEMREPEKAITHFRKVTQLQANNITAWLGYGKSAKELKKHDEAIVCFEKAIQLDPNSMEAWLFKATALSSLKRYSEALACYDQAISLSPDDPEIWSNKGSTLSELKQSEEALVCYDHAIQLNPNFAQAWSNKGGALNDLKRYDEALFYCSKATQLQPDYAEAWSNSGVALIKLQRNDEALIAFERAIQLKPDYARAWSNKGGLFADLKSYDEAMIHYSKAYAIDPTIDFLLGSLMLSKRLLCDWTEFDTQRIELIDKVRNHERAADPFSLLSVVDSPAFQLQAAKIWTSTQSPDTPPPLPKKQQILKIRVGYFSEDFSNHAVAILMAELFEIHDRNRFEIFAISLGCAKVGDTMRSRLVQAFDQFIDLENASDLEITAISRDLQLDIAVDLGGHTGKYRTALFANRVAPIQINFLGYPGTSGADYIDYIIADRHLIPESQKEFYSEKIAYLPNCFQPNDSKRFISDRNFSREELGLPNDGFIFCCFNNSYKLNPTTFDSWMRILGQVDKSCLWLLASSTTIETNLRREADVRGINPERLIFGTRLAPAEYLARYRWADLFLDTLPFNAGTTASDALWAGLPVLTCSGQSFAGRMATSLLHAIELPELITQSLSEYENLAIELATNPAKLKHIRQKLATNRLTTPLFDTQRYTKDIENAYLKMHERHLANLPPETIYIEQ